MQGHGRIIAHDFCVAHREANFGLSTLNRTKSILSIYHQQRQLHNQRGMCLNDTYPFCQQPLSGNCHSICFSKPVLWTATPGLSFLVQQDSNPFNQQSCGLLVNAGWTAFTPYMNTSHWLFGPVGCVVVSVRLPHNLHLHIFSVNPSPDSVLRFLP